ncbi:polysaccharide lyase [Pontibacter qinzhouensis]|uniref:polysaccharide lyase n=1 Tax=Pontibacter qinzhouensis TaxID=2603253 RepID=UPI001C9C1D80|nr:polysaccharide lyase [Pontibacter qinzhouensis]
MKKYLVPVFTLVSLFALSHTARAQYPTIPKEVQAKADADLEEAQRRSDEAWERALPIIDRDARNGKPYIPWAAVPSDLPQADIPAFPGAEGGGMYSFGGRGGKVYVVTNLNDSGPGSFRDACEQGGARIVVFNVAGIIKLKSPVIVRAPYITIAGQTAPGDGVCIAGESVWIDTHDVIIRHMRFRRGETNVARRDDALGGNPIGNLIVDHVSASWGLDENISMYRHQYDSGDGKLQKLPTVNVTFQNCISSECLDTYNHSFGSTIGGLNSTFARNLWASNISRNPSVGMYGSFNFVNNVLFNWWNRSVDGGDHRSQFNMINNYYKPGPITPKDQPIAHRILKPESNRSAKGTQEYGRAYVNGNVVEGNEKVTKDNWDGGVQVQSNPNAGDYTDYIRTKKPFAMPAVAIMPAQEAYQYVLANAGATLPKRDAVDTRIVEQVRTGKVVYKKNGKTGVGSEYIKRRLPEDSYKQGIITHVSQVGGYPTYKGKPYKDSDNDGMPDDWEIKYGLNPNDPSDANGDLSGDGYTNIEKYINGIDPTKKVDWKDLKNNKDTLAKK